MTMKKLKLAVVQFTPEFEAKQRNFARMQQLVESVTADIIVFPELCTTGYFFLSRAEIDRVAETADGESSNFFKDMARKKSCLIQLWWLKAEINCCRMKPLRPSNPI